VIHYFFFIIVIFSIRSEDEKWRVSKRKDERVSERRDGDYGHDKEHNDNRKV